VSASCVNAHIHEDRQTNIQTDIQTDRQSDDSVVRFGAEESTRIANHRVPIPVAVSNVTMWCINYNVDVVLSRQKVQH